MFLCYLELRNFDKCKKIINSLKHKNHELKSNYVSYKILEFERKLNIKVNKYEEAINFGSKLLPHSIENKDWVSVSFIYEDIAICHYFMGRLKDAIKYFERATHIMEKYFIISGLINIYGNLSQLYNLLNDNNKTFYYLNKKLELCESVNDEKELAYVYNALGSYCLNTNNTDSAFGYLKKSEEIFLKYKIWGSYSYLLGNYSLYYENKKDFSNALKYLDLQINLDKKLNNKEAYIRGLNNKGTLYSKFQQSKKGLYYSQKAYKLCITNKFDYLKLICMINFSWRKICLNKFKDIPGLLDEAESIAVKNNLNKEMIYINYLRKFFTIKLFISKKNNVNLNKDKAQLMNDYKAFITSNKILSEDEEVYHNLKEISNQLIN